jgi:hypothetical protein
MTLPCNYSDLSIFHLISLRSSGAENVISYGELTVLLPTFITRSSLLLMQNNLYNGICVYLLFFGNNLLLFQHNQIL